MGCNGLLARMVSTHSCDLLKICLKSLRLLSQVDLQEWKIKLTKLSKNTYNMPQKTSTEKSEKPMGSK